jgi:hypothetical protein
MAVTNPFSNPRQKPTEADPVAGGQMDSQKAVSPMHCSHEGAEVLCHTQTHFTQYTPHTDTPFVYHTDTDYTADTHATH